MTASYDAYYDFDQIGLPDSFLLREAHAELATHPERHEVDLVMRVRTAQLLDKHMPTRDINLLVMSLIAPNDVTETDIKHAAYEFGQEPAQYMKQLSIISQMPEELLPVAPDPLKAYYLAFQMSALSVIWDASEEKEHEIIDVLTRQLKSTCNLTDNIADKSLLEAAKTLVTRMEHVLENHKNDNDVTPPKHDTPKNNTSHKGPKPPKM